GHLLDSRGAREWRDDRRTMPEPGKRDGRDTHAVDLRHAVEDVEQLEALRGDELDRARGPRRGARGDLGRTVLPREEPLLEAEVRHEGETVALCDRDDRGLDIRAVHEVVIRLDRDRGGRTAGG